MAEATKSLAAEIEAVSEDAFVRALRTFENLSGQLRYAETQKWHVRDRLAMRAVLKEFAAAEIAALQGRAFEDGARLSNLLASAQPTVSRQGDRIMLDCPDGTITDEIYEAVEAASYALPLQPEGESDA